MGSGLALLWNSDAGGLAWLDADGRGFQTSIVLVYIDVGWPECFRIDDDGAKSCWQFGQHSLLEINFRFESPQHESSQHEEDKV